MDLNTLTVPTTLIQHKQQEEEEDSKTAFTQKEKWSEVGIVEINPLYGRHVIAGRRIESSEVIIEEIPFLTTPYGDSDQNPLCLGCCKEIKKSEKCTKCGWPLCQDKDCQNDSTHSDYECQIFSTNQIHPKILSLPVYKSIEVLRCLTLRSKSPVKWNRLIQFKAHVKNRQLSPIANQETKFIINFIRDECKQIQYESDVIEKVAGIFSINNFCAFRQKKPFASLIFEKVTILAHNCDPNCRREILETEVIVNGVKKNVMYIRITASKTIEEGEPISIFYADCSEFSDDVHKRRKALKEQFFFDCSCKRCLKELTEN